jgi:cobaltochelatase CobT
VTSNIKPKTPAKEAPTEPFKRAVGVCLKAIAGKGDLEVSFAAERPGLVGGKARLPEPPRRLNEREAAIVRGHADSIALRLACHDPAVHRKLVPGGQQARAVFDAVEQARVEAIGSRRMGGVAKNLTAMLDDRFHRGKFDEISDRADAPIEDALAMLVRERLTGEAPPAAARKLVDLWRPLIEERAGRDLDRLERVLTDQRRFGDVVHDLLDCLDMGEDRSSESDEEEGDEGDQENQKDEQGDSGEASDSADSERMSAEAEASADELPDSSSEAVDAPAAEMADDAEMGDSETAAEPWSGCAAISTSSSRISKASSRGSPIDCSGSSWRSRTAPGNSISKKACSIRRGCRASLSILCIRCRSSARRTPTSATPW